MNRDDFIVESIDDLFPGAGVETENGPAREFVHVPLADAIRHQTFVTLTGRHGVHPISGALEEGNDPHWTEALMAMIDPVNGDHQYRTLMKSAADAQDYRELSQWSIEYLYFLAHRLPERGLLSPRVTEHAAAIMTNTGYSFLELSKQAKEGDTRITLLTRAKKYLEKAIQIDAETPYAHNNLGDVFLSLGNRDLARAHYHFELTHNPSHPTARASLLSIQE